MSFYLDEEDEFLMKDPTDNADMASGPICNWREVPVNRYRRFAQDKKLVVDVELAEAQRFVDEFEQESEFFRNAVVERRENGELKIVGELDCGVRLTIDYETYKDRPESLRKIMKCQWFKRIHRVRVFFLRTT